ncbi:MAG: hypothetical protein ACPG77_20560, partial [Nannocystaceae bacterium]
MYEADSIGAAPRPDQIRVVSGPILWQTNLKFGEAVGYDIDNEIKPIDELGYKPAEVDGGWGEADGESFSNIQGEYKIDNQTIYLRDLAMASVWRMYRCTGQANKASGSTEWSPSGLSDSDYEPDRLDDLLPLFNSRLEKNKSTGHRLPIAVRGVFVDFNVSDENTKPGTLYEGSSAIMGEQGILRFNKPVFQWKDKSQGDDSQIAAPAELTAEVAYGVNIDGVKVRMEKWRDVKSKDRIGTLPRYEHHPEMVPEIIEKKGEEETVVTGNREEVEQQADHYLDALEEEYRNERGKVIQWPG